MSFQCLVLRTFVSLTRVPRRISFANGTEFIFGHRFDDLRKRSVVRCKERRCPLVASAARNANHPPGDTPKEMCLKNTSSDCLLFGPLTTPL